MIQSKIPGSLSDEYEDDSILGITPCSVIEVDQRFTWAYCIHHQGDDHHLWNIILLLPDDMAQYPRKLSFSG
jgi:hypothetical protein